MKCHYCLFGAALIIFITDVLGVGIPLPDTEENSEEAKKACEYMKNFTEVEIGDISHHHYKIVEDCLYYFLNQKAESRLNSLSMNAPPYDAFLPVGVEKVTVKNIITSRMRTRTTLDGKFHISWNDKRLRYDQKRWKIPTLSIKSQYHIWVPELKIIEDAEGSESFYSGFDFIENIKVSPQGKVTAELSYSAYAVCEENFERFPDDRKECCFRVQSEVYTDIIKFDPAHDGILRKLTPNKLL